MALVYYYSPMSSAVRTTWAIEELGLDCERRLIDLAAKGTREPWFLAKNPNGNCAARCQARPAHRRALG